MFKKLSLSLGALLVASVGVSQTIVPTTPQNRNVVLEEFTGVNCQYCPDGHRIAQAIQDANPDRVSLINIHTGTFANPSGNQPDFRTQWGAPIAAQTGLTGFPSGTVNRHVFTGNNTILDRGQWTARSNQILNMPSYVNVGVEATLDINTRELVVNVEVYYTGDSPETTNRLNVALLQNNTKGPQTGGGQGNNYNHMHRLVDLLTGQWGEVIQTTTTGTFVDKTYTYTIPADYRNVDAVLRDMEIVAFVSETRQEIMTGSRAFPNYTGLTITNDAQLISIEPIDPTCSDELSPVIKVSNEGMNPITTLEIDYSINGQSHTYTWTGNITTYQTETIVLPSTPFNLQANNTLNISLPNDEDNTNNTASTDFEEAPEGTSSIYLYFTPDQFANEFSWRITDSQNNTIANGAGYPPRTVTREKVNLPAAGCYTMTINDSFGDGGTRVEIKDLNDDRLFYAVGNWGSRVDGNFAANGVLNVQENTLQSVALYPNPANDLLTIQGVENADLVIFDILGKEVIRKSAISSVENISVSHLQQGTYIVTISRNGEMTTKKFVKL